MLGAPLCMELRSDRRSFLRTSAAWSLGCALTGCAGAGSSAKVRFGVITDVHHDLMPDAPERLSGFLSAMRGEDVDFIVQLGDFCTPHPRNAAFMGLWRSWPGVAHHVIGNHEFDGGFNAAQVRDFYGLRESRYRFTAGGVDFFVLDGNEPGGSARGYRRYVGPEQLAWLDAGMAASSAPKVVLIHQPLDDPDGVENGDAVRAVLERHRATACVSGHLHQDYLRVHVGVAHLQVNSASYYWLGDGPAARTTLPEAVDRAHPWLRRTALYRSPLWAVVELDFARARLTVRGRTSEWLGPDPWTRGVSESEHPRDIVRPAVSPRDIALG